MCRTLLFALLLITPVVVNAKEPTRGDTLRASLGKRSSLEVVFIPPWQFHDGQYGGRKGVGDRN